MVNSKFFKDNQVPPTKKPIFANDWTQFGVGGYKHSCVTLDCNLQLHSFDEFHAIIVHFWSFQNLAKKNLSSN